MNFQENIEVCDLFCTSPDLNCECNQCQECSKQVEEPELWTDVSFFNH